MKSLIEVFLILIIVGLISSIAFLTASLFLEAKSLNTSEVKEPTLEVLACQRKKYFEPRLLPALRLIKDSTEDSEVLTIADFGLRCVNVRYDTKKEFIGKLDGVTKAAAVFITTEFVGKPKQEAGILIHELTHAYDLIRGRNLSCRERERHAFNIQNKAGFLPEAAGKSPSEARELINQRIAEVYENCE